MTETAAPRSAQAPPPSPALDEFEREVLTFLAGHARLREAEERRWGHGPGRVFIFPERSPEEERRDLAAARAWRRLVADAALGWISGPPEYGGRGLPESYEHLYRRLERAYSVPPEAWFTISREIVLPTILTYGTDCVKAEYLLRIRRGELIACQLLSEPEAGSDLANVQTRAERDGGEWVVTGQKVWTSGAQYADLGEIVCRTDAAAPKHEGITAFLVDMHAPGVVIRPLRQMTGGSSFNEVFLDSVRVPDDHRLGDVGQGWSVVMKTLMSERAAFADGASGMDVDIDRLVQLFLELGGANAVQRQQLADIWIRSRVAVLTGMRLGARRLPGEPPGPEMSIGKLLATDLLTRASAFVSAVLGPSLVADSGDWGTYAWSEFVSSTPGARIASGSDEIQRNILSERLLGLPKEPSLT